MVINWHARLFPTFFGKLTAYAEFKDDFHNVSIHAWKDLEGTWHVFPYLVFKTEVQEVVGYSSPKWHEPTTLEVRTRKGTKNSIVKKWKEATQKDACKLAEQKKKEVVKVAAEKAHMEEEHAAEEQVEKEWNDVGESEKSALDHTDEQELSEQGRGGGEE